MRRAQSRRVVVVGLDGASFELLQPWLDAGDLPNLRSLVVGGAAGGLESVVPPLTPPAWTSAVTGVNPGKHGIFNFIRPLAGTTRVEMYGSIHRRAPALWEYLAASGMASHVLHLPATHPPERTAGTVVVGFPVTRIESDCTFPARLKDELQGAVPGYRLYPSTAKLRSDRDAYYCDAIETLRAHAEEALWMMGREPWNLLFTLWHMGDSLMHFFWQDMTGESSNTARKDYIRDYYREADAALGRVIERAGPEAHVIVMSDHGHQGVSRAVHLNAWLVRNGFLRVRIPRAFIFDKLMRRLRRKLGMPAGATGINDESAQLTARTIGHFEKAIVWPETRAYAICPGFVWINLRGREAHGIVAEGDEYRAVREQIRAGLRDVRDPETGEPVFDDVVIAEEVYQGEAMAEAPDIVALPRAGYVTEYGVQKAQIVGPARRVGFNGYHVMTGMLAMAGPEIQAGATLQEARIVDIAPTVLHLLGLPSQPGMDGRVIEAAFTPRSRATRPVRCEAIPLPDRIANRLDGEAARIEESLRDLGYM